MFSWYKYPFVNLVFPHLGFLNGNLFLIALFPDLCLLVPFYTYRLKTRHGVTLPKFVASPFYVLFYFYVPVRISAYVWIHFDNRTIQ